MSAFNTLMTGRAGKTIVVGIGNTIHQDDGAGVHAMRRLETDPRLPYNVDFVDGGTRGLELLADLQNCARVLFLDAVDVGETPGTVIEMTLDDLHGLPGAPSVHQLGLADLLAAMPLLTSSPLDVRLIGIQPAEIGWGTELSPLVQASIGAMVDAAVQQLNAWCNSAEPTML